MAIRGKTNEVRTDVRPQVTKTGGVFAGMLLCPTEIVDRYPHGSNMTTKRHHTANW